MEIRYAKDYLKELYERGTCSSKKYRFQPQVVRKFQMRVDVLIGATKKEDLFPFRSLNFEALHGDKDGLYSLRVDSKYRLEFRLEEFESDAVITICTLEELSNHYK